MSLFKKKNKAIFLDRDGTINRDPVIRKYVSKIKDFKFLPGTIRGLKKLSNLGYRLIVTTNQSGIGVDYYTEKDMNAVHAYMLKKLKENNIRIDEIYFCPHHSEGKGKYKMVCDCRKPGTAMVKKAAKKFNLDFKKCFVIGNEEKDVKTGEAVGCKTILIGSDRTIKADFFASNLLEAAKIIEKYEKKSNNL